MAIARSPIFTSGCSAPHVPTRSSVCTPSSCSSSTPMATEGPPMPVDIADTGTPSTVPVKVRYSRLNATSFAPSRCLAMSGVRNGSPGTSTYCPTSPGPNPMWYFFSVTFAIRRILIGPGDSVPILAGEHMRWAADLAIAQTPRAAQARHDPLGNLLRPRVNRDQHVALPHPIAHGRPDGEPRRGVHLVLLADPADADVDAREPDLERIDPRHVTIARGRHVHVDGRHRQAP